VEIIRRCEEAINAQISGDHELLTDFLDDFYRGKFDMNERQALIGHLSQIFYASDALRKSLVLHVLSKFDGIVAAGVARDAIEDVYNDFRFLGAYLNQLVHAIAEGEGLFVSSCSIEADKNMRLAYALINRKEIVNGDFLVKN